MSNISNKNNFIYPSGTTANRPTSVNNGFIYFNTTIGALQIYQNGSWYVLTNINAPGAPTSVTATDQGTGRAYNNGQMSIAFTPATETFGFPATYTVTSSPGSFTATGSSSPLTITGLQSSTQYTYTVTATNNTGTSSASSASSGITATTVPQAPTIGTATAGDTTATLTFTAGATGGSAITNYKYSTDNITYTAFSPAQTTSPLSFTGLTNGQSYSWYLKAVNANGDSIASNISNSVIPISTAFDSIATIVVGAGGSSNIEFTSIPSLYKHLQVRCFSQTNRGTYNIDGIGVQLGNSSIDTSSNYSWHTLEGQVQTSLTNVSSNFGSNDTLIQGGINSTSLAPDGKTFGVQIIDILDYSSANKFKTLRILNGVDTNGSVAGYNGATRLNSGSWRSTLAIDRIKITPSVGTQFNQYSHFALYGIRG